MLENKVLAPMTESQAGPIRHRRGQYSADLRSGFDHEAAAWKEEDTESSTPEPKDKTAAGSNTGAQMKKGGPSSHSRKAPEGHVKRPPNAFILFRSHACASNLIPPSLRINDHRQISRIVATMWKGLDPADRRIWEEKAQEAKEEHEKLHPTYRYKPGKERESNKSVIGMSANQGGAANAKRKKAPGSKKASAAKSAAQNGHYDEDVEKEKRRCEVVAKVLMESAAKGIVNEDPDALKERIGAEMRKASMDAKARKDYTVCISFFHVFTFMGLETYLLF